MHKLIQLPPIVKYSEEQYPNPNSKQITYSEAVSDCALLAEQLKDIDQIIGVARSGMPFATWVAQMLKVDLGYYNPKYDNSLLIVGNPKKIAFVDETSEWGHTQNKIRVEMEKHPDIEYVIGCVWIDIFHPQFNGYHADDVVYGRKLDCWITHFAGVEKTFNIDRKKFRDNQ